MFSSRLLTQNKLNIIFLGILSFFTLGMCMCVCFIVFLLVYFYLHFYEFSLSVFPAFCVVVVLF